MPDAASDAPRTFRDGRYRVVRVLGEGAQATTFEAVDAMCGTPVAVKCFRVHGARSWKEVELAEREAKVLAGISHLALPRYLEHFEEGGELFLVTEKIEGESLAALRARGVTFSARDVTRLLHDASSALDYLHGRAPPIVHRDIKPSNVILRPDGSYAFIDFGAVRDRMKPEGGSTVVGTFGYMAPEQFQGRAMPASDIYAVGATALTLLTGREPEDLPHKGLALDVPAALAGALVRPALVRVLSAMLVPDPDARAAAIAPLLRALDPPARGEPTGERHEERTERDALRRIEPEAWVDERGRPRGLRQRYAVPGVILAMLLLASTLILTPVWAWALMLVLALASMWVWQTLKKGMERPGAMTRARKAADASGQARLRLSSSVEPGPRVEVPEVPVRVEEAGESTDEEEAEEEAMRGAGAGRERAVSRSRRSGR